MRTKRELDFKFEEIKSAVTEYIPTPHGRIGIIIPENDPTEDQLNELYDVLANAVIEAMFRQCKANPL